MKTSTLAIFAALLPFAVLHGAESNATKSGAVTLINYSTRSVYATAVFLDAQELWIKLGTPPNTPLQVRAVGNGDAAPPYALERADGRPVLRLYAGLPPGKRLDLAVQPAAQWPSGSPISALCSAPDKEDGEIRNGLIRVTFEKGRWSLGFDTTLTNQACLIEKGRTDFWIDSVRHGRLLNEDPEKLGLDPYSRSRLVKSEAFVTKEGHPTFRVERRMTGSAKDLTVIESYELVPGLPLLLYRIRWRNEGDKPLWVAYVRSGDGVKGEWSRDLMPGPLVERLKNPVDGALNGTQTRSAWVGALCRISMESLTTGCGVGLSTLLPNGPVGQGSMIWGCGYDGFQCNFIDPKQGQFPFLVKPGEGLDNGFAFLAASTDVSVWRQTHELWKALQAGKLPNLPPTCAVFADGKPIHAQTVTGLSDPAGTLREAALRLDFNKSYECRVEVETAPVEIVADRTVLLRADAPGSYMVNLNKTFTRKDEAAVLLAVKKGKLRSLMIAETPAEAPGLLSPLPDAKFTDWAAMFRWKAVPMVMDYRIQIARSPDFTAPEVIPVRSSENYPWYMVSEDRLPAPGTWYWRIRGAKGDLPGAWSETRRFVVDNDHSTRPLRRSLIADKPLFTLEATRITDFTSFKPDIPADLAPYIGIIAEGMEFKGLPVDEFARGMEKLPYAFLFRSHKVGLADIEWLFQHVPNMVGIQGGEHLHSFYDGTEGMRYYHRLTKLCAKYGVFHQEADGTYKDDKWQLMMDKQGAFIREYGPWLVLSQKNNIIRRQFYSQSAAMGLWLGGITHQHGAWEDGGFYWQNAGFNGLGVCQGERSGVLHTMPRIFWTLNALMGVSRGCGIYSLDGQTLMSSVKHIARDPAADWASAIWYDDGRMTDTFKRFVVPLVRATVQHKLIPTKDEVLRNVKLAVFNDKTVPGDLDQWPHYVEYGPLYAATYGFRTMGSHDGQLWEFFPNTGRYYFIPVLPQGSVPNLKCLPVSELQDVAKVKSVFDLAYPQWYEGDAWACRVGDTLTIQNSRENEDVTESYNIPLPGRGMFQSIVGKVGPHAYVIGKFEDKNKRLWLQANTEYPERDTEMTLTVKSEPQVVVTPANAAKIHRWDDATRKLTLILSHADGVVEVTIAQ